MTESEREFVRLGGHALTVVHVFFGLILPAACCVTAAVVVLGAWLTR